jgi:hypothetical protein
MARIFTYRYFGDPPSKNDPVERDLNDVLPVPEIGEIVMRQGKNWRVDSVMVVRTIHPKGAKQPPLEYFITLAECGQAASLSSSGL